MLISEWWRIATWHVPMEVLMTSHCLHIIHKSNYSPLFCSVVWTARHLFGNLIYCTYSTHRRHHRRYTDDMLMISQGYIDDITKMCRWDADDIPKNILMRCWGYLKDIARMTRWRLQVAGLFVCCKKMLLFRLSSILNIRRPRPLRDNDLTTPVCDQYKCLLCYNWTTWEWTMYRNNRAICILCRVLIGSLSWTVYIQWSENMSMLEVPAYT
jgi:hypothetical protein